MSLSTTSGAVISIGTTTEAANLTQYAADTYIAIKHVEDIGEFGDEAAEVEFVSVDFDAGGARKQRFKGSQDAGVITLVCGRDPLDAGQQALIAASRTEDEYNLKIVANDAPAGGTPSTFYMRVLVMSAKVNFSGADDVTRITFNLAINTEILEELAEA